MTKIKQSTGMSPIEKAWDMNCRTIPEDGYNIEEDLKDFFGTDVMLKKDFNQCVKKLFNDLYKEIKHGDAEHQKWLKDKITEFMNTKK